MALVGVRASYHRILNQIELLLPAKLRPFYNHPAGKDIIIIRTPGSTCSSTRAYSVRSERSESETLRIYKRTI
uniref:Uncharacterized protein n=1 Tax=Salmo trutta TaxID=8032 RepID=A0A674CY03_SALTR